MILSEIQPGTEIQITASRGLKSMDFASRINSVEGTTLRIEPIYQDGKLVGFDNENIVLSMYIASRDDNKLFVYSGITIHSYRDTDGSIFQEITCRSEEGRTANRRGAHRVWVGASGGVTIGDNKHEYAVAVKDISSTGIAFVADESIEIAMGTPVVVSFTDDVQHKSFRLMATAIRSENSADNKRIIYGCKFKEESNAILKYVNEKQRQNLKETRTVNIPRR